MAIDRSKLSYDSYQIDKWESNCVWPLEVVSQFIDKRELEEVLYFTNFQDASEFKPPLYWSELRSKEVAYFAGVAAGDGGFNGSNIWSIVDGGKKDQIEYSKDFIEDISALIQSIFDISEDSICLIDRDGCIELKISNKFFCRYIRYCFGLPESYKKGKLRKPDIFADSELFKSFWRGVFDTDGSLCKESLRISLSSATYDFLEQCEVDFEEIGIYVYEIRKPSSYLLRLSPRSFIDYVEKIGFSHPRKKKLMLEKLRKGSRNYCYNGLKENNIIQEKYYDLTKIEDLRVSGAHTILRSLRAEKSLYQKELSKELDVPTDQISRWERGKAAIPIEILNWFMDSKLELMELLFGKNCRFKVGKRGNENSLVNLPLVHTPEIDQIASKCISTSGKLNIRKRDDAISRQITTNFGVEVKEGSSRYLVTNWAVAFFFACFYDYSKRFKPYSVEDLSLLREKY